MSKSREDRMGSAATRRAILGSIATGASAVGANVFVGNEAFAQPAKLDDQELKALTADPKKFLEVPENRAKVVGVPKVQLDQQLKDFAKKNNLGVNAMVTEVVTEMIKHVDP